jgi:hypothetical protein
MYARIVTFRIDGVTDTDYRANAATIADSFNDWPGLLAKIWIGDAAAHRYGGIYLFTDATSAQRSRSTPQFTGLATDPAISDLSVEEFDVLEDLTARTAGELLAQLRAGV